MKRGTGIKTTPKDGKQSRLQSLKKQQRTWMSEMYEVKNGGTQTPTPPATQSKISRPASRSRNLDNSSVMLDNWHHVSAQLPAISKTSRLSSRSSNDTMICRLCERAMTKPVLAIP